MKLKKVNQEKGNMYKFITHTGNAIKGICEHDCKYCYMKPKGNLKDVRLDETELKTELEYGNFIFVGSGTDMFASNIPSEWIIEVLNHCNDSDNKFLFQSKNPRRFLEFIEHPVFKKSVICTTIESNRIYSEFMGATPSVEERAKAMGEIADKGIETYVTIEPIMDFDLDELVELIKTCKATQVNIGANSHYKLNQLSEPTRDQILKLIEKLSNLKIVVDKKANLKRLTEMAKIMKKELAEMKEQPVTSISMKVQIMKELENGSIVPNEEFRKFALIKENRPILDKNVYYFLQTIKEQRYNRKLPILTIEASELIEKCNITDFEGNPILDQDTSEYLVVLDGQHRIKAFSLANATNKDIIIPNVHIEDKIENVSEYLVNINTAGHDWSLADKYCVSAITSNNKTIQKIHELIKYGFNPSAAAMICTGAKISPAKLDKLLKEGDTSFLSDEKEDELLQRADQYFIEGMSIDKMDVKILSRRYHVNGFTSFAASRTVEDAIKALRKLKIDDFKSVKQDNEFVEKLRDALALAS
ncbi:radical SAM protein [Dysgonomonas sp. ZJ279]|uniref:radical SAM protein n=1 Tax=Dysgonomonas sp. ZJ279 TaxID=2709796 RepID=UPI00293C007D|nr:radical SAM protein [Dysgonomonas sp. ZJ279]